MIYYELEEICIPDSSDMLDPDNISRILDILQNMYNVCLKSCERPVLFTMFPKLINLIYKLEQIIPRKNYNDIHDTLKKICNSFIHFEPYQISFIVPQLMMIYSTKNSLLYDASIQTLSKYVNHCPFPNAYWLASFINSDITKITSNGRRISKNNDGMITMFQNRQDFGRLILEGLSKQTRKIVDGYCLFVKKLVQIIDIIREKGNDSYDKKKIRKIIDEINSIVPKTKILLPALKYTKLESFNYTENEKELLTNNKHSQSISLDMMQKHYENKSYEYEYIIRMDENYEVMRSKERPVKITFYSRKNGNGSNDEKKYHFLLKSDMNDIIKEIKAVEIFSAINSIMEEEGQNDINLRQYNIVPVDTFVVIVEWLENTIPLKSAIDEMWLKYGIKKGVSDVGKKEGDICKDFYDKCGPTGNLLYKYFDDKYEDPNTWYKAKQKYTISSAIWSMTGRLIGLGDRHIQNIMIDNNGEIVHIDFGILMLAGRKLPVPENIDFRFTQNIRRAMGLFEGNGLFIHTSQLVLKRFVKYYDVLMTQLETLILDPQFISGGR